mmetsp:Transcript_45286/g.72820  ORF Transcript_45286/g.72820 Transcript_45286/m.72820 type:complete len:135 (+) Transcript_45286:652-1056(+)
MLFNCCWLRSRGFPLSGSEAGSRREEKGQCMPKGSFYSSTRDISRRDSSSNTNSMITSAESSSETDYIPPLCSVIFSLPVTPFPDSLSLSLSLSLSFFLVPALTSSGDWGEEGLERHKIGGGGGGGGQHLPAAL